MSDTDKTRPTWVQMLDPHNRGWATEHHDHSRGGCDIADYDPRCGLFGRPTRCCVWPSYTAMNEGIYPRPPKQLEYYVWKAKRRERATWRRLRSELLGGNLDAAEAVGPRYSHRHEGLWDMT